MFFTTLSNAASRRHRTTGRSEVAYLPLAVDIAPPQQAGRLLNFPLTQRRDADGPGTCFFDSGEAQLPAVLFLHGLGGNQTHWRAVVGELRGQARLLGLDLPGFGDSDRATTANAQGYEGLVSHVLSFLDRRGVDRAVVVGHSFGGAIAMELALRHPARVRGLVLASPAGFQRFPSWVRVGSLAALHPALLATVTVLSAPFVVGHVCRRRTREVRDLARSVYRPRGGVSLLAKNTRAVHGLRTDLVNRHFLDELDQVTMPVHSLWGADDPLLDNRQGARAALALPAGRLSWLPGVGHLPLLEAPAAVGEAVLEVLARSQRDGLASDSKTAHLPASRRSA